MGNEEGRGVGGSQVGYKTVGVETSPGDVGNDCVLDNNYEVPSQAVEELNQPKNKAYSMQDI